MGGVPTVLNMAPLGTYTGWNIATTGPHKGPVCNDVGGFIPFATTKADRLLTGDTRPSLEERYVNHAGDVAQVTAAANSAFAQGYLLLNAGGGSATVSPTLLVLVGGDQNPKGCTGGSYEVNGPCQIQAVYALPGTFSFTWAYATADADGPGGDPFGVLLDGVRITLSDLGGAVTQGGSKQYVALKSFGWFINCTDCTGGAATVTITALAVPEPSAWALALLGGCAVTAGVRRARSRPRIDR